MQNGFQDYVVHRTTNDQVPRVAGEKEPRIRDQGWSSLDRVFIESALNSVPSIPLNQDVSCICHPNIQEAQIPLDTQQMASRGYRTPCLTKQINIKQKKNSVGLVNYILNLRTDFCFHCINIHQCTDSQGISSINTHCVLRTFQVHGDSGLVSSSAHHGASCFLGQDKQQQQREWEERNSRAGSGGRAESEQ